MAKLYFRYGLGKSSQLCQVAYNYMNERNMPVAILNAKENKRVVSKVMIDGKNLMERDINITISDDSLYEKLYRRYQVKKIYCVLVDNTEYLTVEQAEDLFFQ